MSERTTPPMGRAAILDAHARLIAAHDEHDRAHGHDAAVHYETQPSAGTTAPTRTEK